MTEPARASPAPVVVLVDDSPYAAYDVTLDDEALGFARTVVTSELGSCVARHRPARGSDRATVFLHGAAAAWTTWTPVLAAAADAGIDIPDPVLLDLPGWGDGRLTHVDAEVTVQAIATLVERMLVELGYRDWDLVGHSLGGFIALHLASIRPEHVRSVAMVSGTTFSVIHSVDHPLTRFGELPGFTMLWRIMQFLATLGAAGTALVRGAGRTGILRLVFAPLFRHGLRMPRSLIRATANDLRPRSFAAAADVARGYDADAQWAGITCPVSALKGDRDVFVTDEDLAHLGRLLPHSVRTVVTDCGHFANVERPVAMLLALGIGTRSAA